MSGLTVDGRAVPPEVEAEGPKAVEVWLSATEAAHGLAVEMAKNPANGEVAEWFPPAPLEIVSDEETES